MRRRVTLYIAEQAADLSDDALVLLNIQREDLYNPAVVLNSYSQAVTLPGTAINDRIFGHYFRADHSVAGGFNPLVRVPFSIFDATGEVLVAGYCKLLNVTSQKGAHTYEVQLYGSLGEFIYGLAYDADGNKKSLASLDYLGGGDTELDFTINAQAVKDAWARLGNPAPSSVQVVYPADLSFEQGGEDYSLPAGTSFISMVNGSATRISSHPYPYVQPLVVIPPAGYKYFILFFNDNDEYITYYPGWQTTRMEFTSDYPRFSIVIAKTNDSAISPSDAPSVNIRIEYGARIVWDVISFAPCYNGIPDGDFDAGKALAKPGDVGLTIPPGQQASSGGYTLLELAADLDEWEARDLRSYLQRPVLSVKALLEAIAKPENNGGWTIDLSDIDTTAEWPYLRTWITRPLLPSLGTFTQTTGSITATPSSSATSGPDLVSIALANVPPGTDVTLRASFTLQVNLASAPGLSAMQTRRLNYGNEYQSVWFVQLVGYASDNSVVAASPVTIFGPTLSFISDLAQFAEDCTFTPIVPTGQTAEYVAASGIDQSSLAGSGTAFSSRGAFSLETTGKNMASAKVIVKRGTILWNQFSGRVYSMQNLATLYTDTAPTATAYAESTSQATGISVTASMQSASALRSGARVTKQMLLSTEGTPADYLLAICKSFGLYILADGATKTASIVRRTTLYQNETIDLTERVDTSQEVELQPLAIESKYYVWKHDDVGAAFGKEYKENTGRDYGAQRVNTGYDFDAKERNVLDGVVLKGTAAVVKSGRFMIQAPAGGTYSAEITPSQVMPDYLILDDGTISPYPSYELRVYDVSGLTSALITGRQGMVPGYAIARALDAGGNILQIYILSDRTNYTDKEITLPDGAVRLDVTGFTGQVGCKGVYPIVTPPVFILPGSKYTLWDGNGDSQENDVPQYVGAVTPLRSIGPYDFYDKAQFHGADGKPVDGADVLLLYNGTGDALRSYPLEITDDVADMDTLNGKPCWLFTNNTTPLQLPYFSRYDINIAGWVTLSLDFGVPGELDIPNLDYFAASTIYAKAWKDYVADRLDKDTKVLRCRVRLDGLQVGQGLLRKFYWYRGSLWALNKITNYSLTTYDPAECEFIQVQDIDNYV